MDLSATSLFVVPVSISELSLAEYDRLFAGTEVNLAIKPGSLLGTISE